MLLKHYLWNTQSLFTYINKISKILKSENEEDTNLSEVKYMEIMANLFVLFFILFKSKLRNILLVVLTIILILIRKSNEDSYRDGFV